MTDIYEYVTSASTRATVHVRRQRPGANTRTLCGTYIRPTWTEGDETTSAHLVTCIACARRIDADRNPVRKCITCGGRCLWAEDAWTCTRCGDEWDEDALSDDGHRP